MILLTKKTEEIKKGLKSLVKLNPLFKIAIISESFAIFEVKKIAEINIKRWTK